MNNDIYLVGEIGSEVTLATVLKQVQASDKDQPLNVHIHSGGGSVYDGIAIYNLLKSLHQEVNTISNGLVASIASIIFLAGANRTINTMDNFLIHLPMSGSQGNAVDLEKTAKELRSIESKLAQIYANETSITVDEAMALMLSDEMLDVEMLKDKGFVTEIVQFQAVANLNNKNNENMSEILTKKEAESLFEKFGNKLKSYFNPENKIVQDATGMEIDFPDVEDGIEPIVGDTAIIDGKAADGDYTMPSGQVFKFVAGVLTEIVEGEAPAVPEPTEPTEAEVLQAKIDSLTEQLQVSAELITDKETLITAKDTEITNLTNDFKTLESDFTEVKNKVVSNFEYTEKVVAKTGDAIPTSRTTFKSKVK
jgi:ATP-dependent Clp endopeptidase proteolytic subunit ClpP